MSDRIAVFNEGRIEQVGTPVEVYERPADRVRRRLRRRLEHPRAGRPALHRPPREDPPARRRRAAAAGEETESGVLREVVYLGSVTRYLVELDAGGGSPSSARTTRRPRDARAAGQPRAARLAAGTHTFHVDRTRQGREWSRSKMERVACGAWALVAAAGSVRRPRRGSVVAATARRTLPTSIGAGRAS